MIPLHCQQLVYSRAQYAQDYHIYEIEQLVDKFNSRVKAQMETRTMNGALARVMLVEEEITLEVQT